MKSILSAAPVAVIAALVLGLACATTGFYGAAGLRVDCNVPEATVWVDDALIGRASDWSADGKFVRPGFHRLEVRAQGYYSHFAELEMKEGTAAVVKAELRPQLD